jgi:hypothetical protein
LHVRREGELLPGGLKRRERSGIEGKKYGYGDGAGERALFEIHLVITSDRNKVLSYGRDGRKFFLAFDDTMRTAPACMQFNCELIQERHSVSTYRKALRLSAVMLI